MQGRDRGAFTIESVVMDVTSSFGERVPSLGKLADLGLCSFHFFMHAFSSSEIVAEHILAAAVWRRDTAHLIVSTLRAINQAPAGWAGNEALNAAIMILRVVASVSDERRAERISLIMQCTDPPAPNAEFGMGLVIASRAYYAAAQQAHTYPNEIAFTYERYVGILKELLPYQHIYHWMSENRNLWAFMERDLLDPNHHPSQNARSDFGGQRDGEIPGIPINHHSQSDSDALPGMQDSEDDEDSRFEEMENYEHGPRKIKVEGAGNPAVNGVYLRDGFFERASKFSRRGEYHGKACDFYLFKCNVSNNTKHWYLSIVPNGQTAGTSSDTDFYSAPVNETCAEFPPLSGWTTSNEGVEPAPTLIYYEIAPGDDAEMSRSRRPLGWDSGDQPPSQMGSTYGNV